MIPVTSSKFHVVLLDGYVHGKVDFFGDVKHGMRVIAIGVAVGMGLALLAARLISSMIYGVRPTDPATLGSASLGLVVVAFLATYIPARRATKVDPMVALRHE